jgi:pimeloyl-ACP methyl ester carboxylesterase
VLLHGGFGSWTHWLRNIGPLAEHHSVLVPDMPGFGDSDPIEGEPDAETIAGHLWYGLNHIAGDATNVTLAGFSFGGAIGGTMAAQQPQRTRKLILIGSGGMRATRGPVGELVRWRDAADEAAVRAAHRRNLEILMFRDASLIDPLAIALQAENTRRTRGKSRPSSRGVDLGARLAGSGVSVAGIGGEFDATAGDHVQERADIIRAIDPDSTFRVIEGAGHWVQFEAADGFNETMIALLREEPGRARGLRAGPTSGETKHTGGMP